MPASNQLRVSKPLQDFTVGLMQEDTSFILRQAATFLPVQNREDKYFVYDAGNWNRREMQLRGPSEQSSGSGWTLSTDSYKCERFAVHKDFEWDDADDADPAIDLEPDAAEWAANQIRMQGDWLFNAAVMQPATWTTDLDGVASGQVEGTSVLHWSDSSSDPQADVQYIITRIKTLAGKDANLISLGSDVYSKLVTNAAVRDAIKYTEPTLVRVVQGKLASYLGVDRLVVGAAVQNTAAEGATTALAQIVNPKDVFVGYVNPKPGKRTYTAFKAFAWKGRDGGASDGVIMRKFDMQELTSTRVEAELRLDIKVVAADAGAFIDGAVA